VEGSTVMLGLKSKKKKTAEKLDFVRKMIDTPSISDSSAIMHGK